MKLKILGVVMGLICGCGGSEFAAHDVGISMGADAAIEASEVDTQTPTQDDAISPDSSDVRGHLLVDAGADMQAEGEASAPFEASTDGGPNDGATGGVPTCGENEVYPQPSNTCMTYIKGTAYPLYTGCCQSNHVCGMVLGRYCESFPGSE